MIALLLAALALPVQTGVEVVAGGRCDDGFRLQQEGRFATFLSCDPANPAQLVIVYFLSMKGPRDEGWSYDQRFWQDPKWSADVTSLAWLNPERLLVATGAKGSGGLYLLELGPRAVKALIEPAEGQSIRIKDVEGGVHEARVAVEVQGEKVEHKVITIP